MTDDSSAFGQPPPEMDTSVAHSARVWNYFLGGKDNFPMDREAGDEVLALMPEIVDSARADRAFLGRVVRHVAGEAGVRQFLDIGTVCPPPTTLTRSRRRSRRSPASSTSTTTPSSWCTPARC